MAKSTHQPFDDWILSQRPLSPYQAQTLQQHLHDCDACRELKESLNGVERIFKTAPQVAPKANFTARWLERQAAEKLARQRQQAWIVFGIVSVNALALIILLGSQIATLIGSPTNLLLLRAYTLSLGVSLLELIRTFALAGFNLRYGFPLAGLVLFTGVTSFLSVLWLVTYRQLTSSTRSISL